MATPVRIPASSRSTTPAEPRRGSAAPGPRAARKQDGRLRVLLVLESAGAGAGHHVIDLARGLLRRGHDVELAWSPLRAEPAFLAALRAEPRLVTHAIAMRRAPAPGDLMALHALRRLLARRRFDIVHGHSSKAGALVRLACAGRRTAVLYTPHAFVTLDPGLPAVQRWLFGRIERVLARLADRIVCVSEEERAHALALGIPARRLAVVPNGLAPLPAPDRGAARRALGIDDDAVCVGFVGRLTAQKAADRLLAAFARACPEGSPGRLAIIGDGPQRPALAALARSLGIAGRVVFTGPGDGPALMAGFDVFVLPSRSEGGPYVLLEAAARALPIVSTAVGGVSTVVHEGENGFIVAQEDDAGAMAAALARPIGLLVRDREARETMGRNSAAMAAGLTADAMVERTLALYRDVLAGQ